MQVQSLYPMLRSYVCYGGLKIIFQGETRLIADETSNYPAGVALMHCSYRQYGTGLSD